MDDGKPARWIGLAAACFAVAAAWFALYTAYISVPVVPGQDADELVALNSLFVWYAEHAWQQHAILLILAAGFLALAAGGTGLRSAARAGTGSGLTLAGSALIAGGLIGAVGAIGHVGLHQGIIDTGNALPRQATSSIIWYVGDAVAGALYGGAWALIGGGVLVIAASARHVAEVRFVPVTSTVLGVATLAIAALYLFRDPIVGREPLLAISGLVLFPLWAVAMHGWLGGRVVASTAREVRPAGA